MNSKKEQQKQRLLEADAKHRSRMITDPAYAKDHAKTMKQLGGCAVIVVGVIAVLIFIMGEYWKPEDQRIAEHAAKYVQEMKAQRAKEEVQDSKAEAEHLWNVAHGVNEVVPYISRSCVNAIKAHPEIDHPCANGELNADEQYIHDLAAEQRKAEENGR